MTLIAIDVLLNPDAATVEKAQAANARLRENYPDGFALDASHAPHITLLQQFVHTEDLDKVASAVTEVLHTEPSTKWESTATSYYDLADKNIGLVGIVIEPTDELRRLQQRIIDAIAPFAVEKGTGEAFAPRPDGGPISQPTVDYVNNFVGPRTGMNYHPHLTVGIGYRDFVDRMKAEPFEPFTFRAVSMSIYHVGDFGVAQRKLYDIPSAADPLPSWNAGSTKQAILDFVTAVATPGSPDFVPPSERIATFDNDGTLWCEKPGYIQLFFALQRLKDQAAADPSLLAQPAYKAAAENDLAYFDSLYPGNISELMKVVFDTHAGMTQEEFEAQAYDFLCQAIHPRYGRPFMQLGYQPMVELFRYLEANGFKVFIASAGGMSFMRTVSEAIYGIPREQVIGSNIAYETRMTEAGPVLFRKPGLVEPISDGPGKPVSIELHIGRKPILAGGNANGDLHMLWYSQTSSYRSLQLLLRHNDAEREYAYDAGAEKVQQMAAERDWQVISMRQDFLKVFAFE
jgi:phosphoglycolate phosphatase-like HAD superfamily hydrolase